MPVRDAGILDWDALLGEYFYSFHIDDNNWFFDYLPSANSRFMSCMDSKRVCELGSGRSGADEILTKAVEQVAAVIKAQTVVFNTLSIAI